MNVFYHASHNFGDRLTPFVLNYCGIMFDFIDREDLCYKDHYLMTGSIITAASAHSEIYGSGVAQEHDMEHPHKIHAVRGVKTREFLLSKGVDCPEVYGDFSLLLPLLIKPAEMLVRKEGLIHHIADYCGDGHDIGSSVEDTINYITSSEVIKTSSLHVFMTANFYGVKAIKINSDNVIGQNRKFDDFLSTVYSVDEFIEACPVRQLKEALLSLK